MNARNTNPFAAALFAAALLAAGPSLPARAAGADWSSARQQIEEEAETIKGMTQQLERQDGYLEVRGYRYDLIFDRAEGEKTLAHNFEQSAGGEQIPAGLFKPLDDALDGLWAEINRLAPTWKFPAGSHAPAIEARARRQIAQNQPQEKVIKTVMLDASWTINRDELNNIVSRTRVGAVLYKAPGDSFCRFLRFEYTENYAGGGSYVPPDEVDFGYQRLQGCQ